MRGAKLSGRALGGPSVGLENGFGLDLSSVTCQQPENASKRAVIFSMLHLAHFEV